VTVQRVYRPGRTPSDGCDTDIGENDSADLSVN
jgi:hypothetical protein